jgi:hypothetical protein
LISLEVSTLDLAGTAENKQAWWMAPGPGFR